MQPAGSCFNDFVHHCYALTQFLPLSAASAGPGRRYATKDSHWHGWNEEEYKVEIPEILPAGSTVVQVNARDNHTTVSEVKINLDWCILKFLKCSMDEFFLEVSHKIWFIVSNYVMPFIFCISGPQQCPVLLDCWWWTCSQVLLCQPKLRRYFPLPVHLGDRPERVQG